MSSPPDVLQLYGDQVQLGEILQLQQGAPQPGVVNLRTEKNSLDMISSEMVIITSTTVVL